MTRFIDREQARLLRKQGRSYSEIKQLMGISKSTLSGWLQDMPLSTARINELRAKSPRRIERFQETMRAKREVRLSISYERARNTIGTLSQRDLFIAGLYLYWGEGLKASKGTVGISNTDPALLRAFLDWAKIADIPKAKIKVRLHLYKDMNIKRETVYWSEALIMPISRFQKPYIKDSSLAGLTYKNGYGHGTCNLRFENMPMWEYITMALKYIREQHTRP